MNMWYIESPSPSIVSRLTVAETLPTGLISIDSIIPIGLGQRELIVGDRQTGKTSIALDTVLNQKNNSILSVYVSIGQKSTNNISMYQSLIQGSVSTITQMVSSTASDTSVNQYISPYTGSSIADYHMLTSDQSVHLVYDDLTKQAMSYREIYLLLRRPPGREAYPGEIFYVHSRLLERCSKLNYNIGGGSSSSYPVVETLAGDVSSYITTNVISITDGQIFLSNELFLSGIKPAIDVGLSVTRVGTSSQWYGMKEVAGKYKLTLAQYAELQAFTQFTSEIQDDTKEMLDQGQKITEVLKQNVSEVNSQEQSSSLVSWTGTKGFSKIPKERIPGIKTKLKHNPSWNNLYIASHIQASSITVNSKINSRINSKINSNIRPYLANHRSNHKSDIRYSHIRISKSIAK
jgi:F-type H+-transporting ATPase subunit alpha